MGRIFWHSICQKFWNSIWISICNSYIYIYILTFIWNFIFLIYSGILSVTYSDILKFYLSHILTCYLAVCLAIRHSTWRYLIEHPLDSIWYTFRDSHWNSIWHPLWHLLGFCIWHFWATLLPKVVSLQILTSKFVIPSYEVFFSHNVNWRNGSGSPALASLLFDPRRPKPLGKHNIYLHLLSTGSFSSVSFSWVFGLFFSLTLLTSAASSDHTVGNLTSKLLSRER